MQVFSCRAQRHRFTIGAKYVRRKTRRFDETPPAASLREYKHRHTDKFPTTAAPTRRELRSKNGELLGCDVGFALTPNSLPFLRTYKRKS